METTTQQTMRRYVVVSPQESQGRADVGAHAEQFGWSVKDMQAGAATGQVFWKGGEREMRAIARTLERRRGTRS